MGAAIVLFFNCYFQHFYPLLPPSIRLCDRNLSFSFVISSPSLASLSSYSFVQSTYNFLGKIQYLYTLVVVVGDAGDDDNGQHIIHI